MKTRNAFALRGFDSGRILARIDARLKGRTDEAFLAAYKIYISDGSFADDNQFSAAAVWTLNQAINMANQYQTRLTRHNDRLLRYTVLLVDKYDIDEVIQSKVRRAKILSDCYANAARSVQDLQKKIHKLIMAIDDCREDKYRRRFSERLREARAAAGMTQLQVANKLEMTAGGYNQYETARRDPSIPTLIKIARILNRSADWLLGLTP